MTFYNEPERYVQVKDLPIGSSQSYTDYEELAFSDTSDWVDKLRRMVVHNVWTTHRRDELNKDLCDMVFYSSVHVLDYWVQIDEKEPTEQMMQLVTESCHHLLDTLNCQHVCRADTDWKELSDEHLQQVKNDQQLLDK